MEARRTALRYAAVGLVVHLALVAVFLLKYDRNPEYFVHFGRQGSVMPLARKLFGRELLVPHKDGHDGQTFWLLARDPLLLHGNRDAHLYDRPGYRAQRIGYSALAAPWRLIGGEHALFWGLLLTNLAMVLLGGYVAALIAFELRAPPRAALALALNPAVITAVILDTSDTMALAFLLLALYLLLRHRTGWAVAAGTVGVLAKEPTLLGLAGVALLAPVLDRRTRVALVGIPGAAAGAWFLYAHWRLGWPSAGIQEFAAPFYGYYEAFMKGWRPIGNWADAIVAVLLIPLAWVVLARFRRRPSLLLAAAVPFAAMLPFLSGQVFDLADNSLRALGPAITLLALDFYVPGPQPAAVPPQPAREAAPVTQP